MKREPGFTLIELLVVIAIIAILAGIVVPRISVYMSKARATRALVDIKSIDLAITQVLTDANVKSFRHLFVDPTWFRTWDQMVAADRTYMNDLVTNVYTPWLYQLLRQGRNATIPLRWDLRDRLGEVYLDLGRDPWGVNLYQFYPGPWEKGDPVWLRTYLQDTSIPGSNPGDSLPGFPAPVILDHYIWSLGDNLEVNQYYRNYPPEIPADYTGDELHDYFGGGDDINNWDNEQSWSKFYS